MQIYQIRIKGRLEAHWVAWFDDEMTIENHENGEATLSGPVADQAALYSILLKIRNLGLSLLSLTVTAPPADT